MYGHTFAFFRQFLQRGEGGGGGEGQILFVLVSASSGTKPLQKGVCSWKNSLLEMHFSFFLLTPLIRNEAMSYSP